MIGTIALSLDGEESSVVRGQDVALSGEQQAQGRPAARADFLAIRSVEDEAWLREATRAPEAGSPLLLGSQELEYGY